ncbi:MAG: hypothetical protein AB8I56_06910, partial [Anaerolineales bacterium]
RISAADSGGFVHIWDLPAQGVVSVFQVPGEARAVDWASDGDHVLITSSLGTSPFIRQAWQSTEEQVRSAHQCCADRDLTPEERARFGLISE